jgi:hypothetical protein
MTVVTCPHAEVWCSFHLATVPKESATNATSGIQTRAKTLLPIERELTRITLSGWRATAAAWINAVDGPSP